ncbi:DUF6461 domain-containing protein [Amycolatopsis sp. NPDC102389]|uniref:DUF6461 domain-containing protein n=1 Tax=Amycolatopsis sp. NPDC102389 TaxID=3363941 RepID=UPI0037FE18F5
MAEPVNLVAEFGEGWCVTVVRGRAPDAVLTVMGAAPGSVGAADPGEVPFGVMDREMVLARALPGLGWTLVVEFDGPTGFLGWQPETLAVLSSGGGAACVATYLPNVQEVRYAEDGDLVAVTYPLSSYRRWGSDPDRFTGQMRDLGFPLGDYDEFIGVAKGLPAGPLCMLLMEVMTGVRLDLSHFAGPWLGGMVRFDESGTVTRFE